VTGAACSITSPWAIYQLWQFVAAGLFPKERKYVTKYMPLSIVLLVTGMLFIYYIVLPITLLGENLALYRTEAGELGLVSQRCPHRGASLAYGIPEDDGLRCPYHGWLFNGTGQCLEQPAEPSDSVFKHRVRIPAYPVQEMGGLIWAYL